jgi:hypothetical protein
VKAHLSPTAQLLHRERGDEAERRPLIASSPKQKIINREARSPSMPRLRLFLFAALGAIASAISSGGAAHAGLIGDPLGISYASFDSLPLGSAGAAGGAFGVSFTGDGRTVIGDTGGLYAPPLISNSTGSSIAIMLPGAMQSFGLVWGSVGSRTDDVNVVSDLMFDEVVTTSPQYTSTLIEFSYTPAHPGEGTEVSARGLRGPGLRQARLARRLGALTAFPSGR